MNWLTKKKDKEPKNDPSKKKDDTSNTEKKSENDENSDARPNEEQSGTKSATEKSSDKYKTPDESTNKEHSGTKSAEKSGSEMTAEDRSDSGKGSENSSVNDSEKDPEMLPVMFNTYSENTQEVKDRESKSSVVDMENSEANDDVESYETREIPQEDKKFTFDEIVEIVGFGPFQRKLTFLAGIGWMADAFEIRVMGMVVSIIACDWTIYRWTSAILISIAFVGMMFGAPIFGIIADKFGRRKSLAISLLCLFLSGASSAVSPNIGILLVTRCITGFVFGGATQGFTLCTEYYPVSGRGTALFYLRYYWAFGSILLILLTWLIVDVAYFSWHWLVLAAATPSLIVFFSMNWFPESARWYLVSGRYDKAVEQLDKLLAANGCTELQATQLKRIPDEEKEAQGNLLDLIRSPHTKTTLILWYISFAVSFHYFGLTFIAPYVINHGRIIVPVNEDDMGPAINSTTSEYFQKTVGCKHMTTAQYVNLLWNTASEFPGLLIFTLIVRFAQRRTLLSVACMINAFATLLILAEANSRIPTQIVLFLARANCTGILQLAMIITTESFPTTLRATGAGSGEAFMRLGGALVPFVTQILIIVDPIASVCIMGAVMFGAAAGGAYLPRDTKGIPLKELTEHQRIADQQKKEADKKV